MLPHLIGAVKRVGVALVHAEVHPDVRYPVKADPVGDRPLGSGADKPVGVADDPVGHKAAVAAAGLADLRPVDLGVGVQHRVGEVHQVLVVGLAVMAADIHKLVVPAVAAHRVAVEDKVAHVRPDLHLMVEDRAVGRLGAAVDIQDRRVFLFGVEVLREQHPSADRPAFAFDADRLRDGDVFPFQDGVVEVADPLHLTGREVRFIQFLQTVVIEGHHQRLAARFGDVEPVDAAFLLDDRRRLPVHRQGVEVGAALPGGQVVEGVPAGLHLLPAAVPAVAADARVHAVLLLPDDFQFAGPGVHRIDPGVFVHAVAAPFGAQQQQAAAHRHQVMGTEIGIFRHLFDLTGRDVVGVKGAAAADRPAFIPVAQEVDGIPHHLEAGSLEKRVGQPFAAAVCRIVHKQRPAQLVGDPAAVAPEGGFVKDLVVFFLFLRLVRLFPLFGGHLVIVGAAGVDAPHRQPLPVPEFPQLTCLKRKGERGKGFAAGHVQPVEAGKLFPRLLPLLFGRRTDCREEDVGLVFPDILPFLPQIGQLAQLPVVHPQPALIAVLLLVAVGDDKGGALPAGCVPDAGEETVV